MLSADQDRVAVVLVRARNPSNIGAVARAMVDLGYRDLRVVNEYRVPFEAVKSAVDAAAVVASAQEHMGVAAAVGDCTLVLGTTAVGERALEHPLYTLRQAVGLVRQALASDPQARVALLFGSEKTGLTNDELSHCHGLVTIPMSTRDGARHLSMNLGQAAAVCLYALAESDDVEPAPTEAPATAAEVERVTALLLEVLESSGYTRRHPANAREASVRRMILRMRLSAADATVWMGLLRQLRHAIEPTA